MTAGSAYLTDTIQKVNEANAYCQRLGSANRYRLVFNQHGSQQTHIEMYDCAQQEHEHSQAATSRKAKGSKLLTMPQFVQHHGRLYSRLQKAGKRQAPEASRPVSAPGSLLFLPAGFMSQAQGGMPVAGMCWNAHDCQLRADMDSSNTGGVSSSCLPGWDLQAAAHGVKPVSQMMPEALVQDILLQTIPEEGLGALPQQ